LLGGGGDQLLEAVREIGGHAREVVAERAGAGRVERREDAPEVPTARQQIGADGQQRRAGPQRERGGARGQRRALAEELHGDPVAREVAVAHEAHHPVRAQRPHHAAGRVRPECDDVHPEAAPRLDEPVEQVGRLDRFGHDDRRIAAGREPGAGIVVVAEVRQGDDRPATGPVRGLDVLEALTVEVGLDRRRGLVLEPEELVPVPPVVVEHRAHRPFELGTLQASPARTDEVTPDLRPLDRPGVHHGTRRRAGPRVAERVREHAREVSAGPVREIRRAVADAGHVAFCP
jgi:hypothetical protein